MNHDERYKITSNEYADLLIEYDGDMNIFNNYPNNSINFINDNLAVIHIPVDHMTPNSIYKYTYQAIPSCYGLGNSPGQDSPAINGNLMNFELKGQGVLVGFVDTGIDYTHQAFRKPDNSSRIISIWDQTIDSVDAYPPNIHYGTVFGQAQINLALESANPHAIVPSMDDNGHGTMLAGIAAGSPIVEHSFSSIVPESDLVIVKLKKAKPYLKDFFSIPHEALCYQENDIIFGVKYLLQVAAQLNRPIAICIGVSCGFGDYSGTNKLCEYLSLANKLVGTTVIVAAGDEGNRGHHCYREIVPEIGYETVEFNVGEHEQGFSMLFWGNAPNIFTIDMFAPTGEFVYRISQTLSQRQAISIIYQDTSILVDNQIKHLPTGDHLILFRFKNPMRGVWEFRIYGEEVLTPITFHSWLPIQSFLEEDTFFYGSSPYTTINSPGTMRDLLTVTPYNREDQTIYYYGSRGYTVLGTPKPDITAPGVNIYCPTLDNQFTSNSGSSLSAAYITGVSSLLLEWGIIKENFPSINGVLVKRLQLLGARRDPTIIYPNPEWGYGLLDLYNVTTFFLSNLI